MNSYILHKYLYANGNPVKYVDPSGNEAQLSTQVVVGAIMNVLDNGQTICIGAIMNSIIFAGATAFCDGSDNDIYNAFVAGFCIGLGLGAVAYFVMAISFVAYLEIFMYISAGAYALSSYDAINYAMNGEYKKAIVSAAFAYWSLDGFASLYNSFTDINLMRGVNITEKANVDVKRAGQRRSGTTKLYRAMSQAEYDSVIQNQKFIPYDLAMEDKWFATTQEDASKWGDIFYPDGNYRILEVEVDTNSLNKMYYVDYLDNIGPAYCSPLDILEESIRSIKGVK